MASEVHAMALVCVSLVSSAFVHMYLAFSF
jgi:hypothetical protein